MNSGMHSPTPTQTCTFPVYWLFSALPISHTILGTNIGIIVEYVIKKKHMEMRIQTHPNIPANAMQSMNLSLC